MHIFSDCFIVSLPASCCDHVIQGDYAFNLARQDTH